MRDRLVTVAAPGTPCGWTHRDSETGVLSHCASGKPAVHVLTETLPVAVAGTALCAYHSPWDVTDADRAEQSGLEILADMLTLDADGTAGAVVTDVKAFHKLSDPMIHVLRILAERGGSADSWAMRNVVIAGIRQGGVRGATMATPKALERRGMVETVANDGPGSLHITRLTARGWEAAREFGAVTPGQSQAIECEVCHAAPSVRSLELSGTFVGSGAPDTQGADMLLCEPCYRGVLATTDERGSGVVYVLWHAHTLDGPYYRYNDRSLTTRYVMIGTDQADMSDRARNKGRELHPGYYATVTGCGFDNPNAQRAYQLVRNGVAETVYMTPSKAGGTAWKYRHGQGDQSFSCAEIDPVTGDVVAWVWPPRLPVGTVVRWGKWPNHYAVITGITRDAYVYSTHSLSNDTYGHTIGIAVLDREIQARTADFRIMD